MRPHRPASVAAMMSESYARMESHVTKLVDLRRAWDTMEARYGISA